MQILSFVSVIQYGCWSRDWKRSIVELRRESSKLIVINSSGNLRKDDDDANENLV